MYHDIRDTMLGHAVRLRQATLMPLTARPFNQFAQQTAPSMPHETFPIGGLPFGHR